MSFGLIDVSKGFVLSEQLKVGEYPPLKISMTKRDGRNGSVYVTGMKGTDMENLKMQINFKKTGMDRSSEVHLQHFYKNTETDAAPGFGKKVIRKAIKWMLQKLMWTDYRGVEFTLDARPVVTDMVGRYGTQAKAISSVAKAKWPGHPDIPRLEKLKSRSTLNAFLSLLNLMAYYRKEYGLTPNKLPRLSELGSGTNMMSGTLGRVMEKVPVAVQVPAAVARTGKGRPARHLCDAPTKATCRNKVPKAGDRCRLHKKEKKV